MISRMNRTAPVATRELVARPIVAERSRFAKPLVVLGGISSAILALHCGSAETGPERGPATEQVTKDGGIPLYPEGGSTIPPIGNDAALVNDAIAEAAIVDAPVVDAQHPPISRLLESQQIVALDGATYQARVMNPITVKVEGAGLSGLKKIAAYFQSDSTLIDPDYKDSLTLPLTCLWGGLNGKINDINDPFNFTLNPFINHKDEGNRMKVYLHSVKITNNLDGQVWQNLYDAAARPLIGAVCANGSDGQPVEVVVPAAFYQTDVLDITIDHSVGLDAQNYVYGNWAYRMTPTLEGK